MNLYRIGSMLLSFAAICLVLAQAYDFAVGHGGATEIKGGTDVLVSLVIMQFGLPIFLALLSYLILTKVEKGEAPLLNMALVAATLVILGSLSLVFLFIFTLIGGLIYAMIVSGLIGIINLTQYIDGSALTGWIFFFFIVEFFSLLLRYMLNIDAIKALINNALKDLQAGTSSDKTVLALCYCSIFLASAKVLAVTVLSYIIFANVKITNTSIATIAVGLFFTIIVPEAILRYIKKKAKEKIDAMLAGSSNKI